MEIWKDIKGLEGCYQVSNFGNIKSLDRYVISNNHGGKKLLKSKIMKQTKSKGRNESDGYFVVNLKSKVYLVHRIVAEAFIENNSNLPTVNHIDGNKLNNNINNLEWVTYSQNNQHAIDNFLREPKGNIIIQYDKDMNKLNEFKSVTEASIITNTNRCMIGRCAKGKCKFAGGFIWEYKK